MAPLRKSQLSKGGAGTSDHRHRCTLAQQARLARRRATGDIVTPTRPILFAFSCCASRAGVSGSYENSVARSEVLSPHLCFPSLLRPPEGRPPPSSHFHCLAMPATLTGAAPLQLYPYKRLHLVINLLIIYDEIEAAKVKDAAITFHEIRPCFCKCVPQVSNHRRRKFWARTEIHGRAIWKSKAAN